MPATNRQNMPDAAVPNYSEAGKWGYQPVKRRGPEISSQKTSSQHSCLDRATRDITTAPTPWPTRTGILLPSPVRPCAEPSFEFTYPIRQTMGVVASVRNACSPKKTWRQKSRPSPPRNHRTVIFSETVTELIHKNYDIRLISRFLKQKY